MAEIGQKALIKEQRFLIILRDQLRQRMLIQEYFHFSDYGFKLFSRRFTQFLHIGC
ncbi:hypothetical protein D3C73_545550 [compost metagenome]